MNLIEVIKLGREYLKLWPERTELGEYFKEYQIIKFSRLVCKYLPALSVIVLVTQLYVAGLSYLPHALVYFLFILSLPIQTLLILGLKADKFLPSQLSSWYKQGVAKINESGGNIKLSMKSPRYKDLAYLLHVTYQQRSH